MGVDKKTLFLAARDVRLSIPVTLHSSQSAGFNWRSFVGRIAQKENREIHNILDGISFELRAGDRLGLQGRNGAGKSTLLKVLAGAYPVTSGEVISRGKVQNLVNISLGMHPEANGYENILLRGLYMDIPLKVMRQKADDIIDFAELENDIYKPLHTYSAGMKARLSLAIALSLDPEILLLDEWLGRGDPQFQAKAANRLQSFMDSAGIVVFASHSDRLLKRICNRIIDLEKGKIIKDEANDPALAPPFMTPEEKRQQKIKDRRRKEIIAEKRKAEIIREKTKQAKIKDTRKAGIIHIIREKRKADIIREKRKAEIIREKTKQVKIKDARKAEIIAEKRKAKKHSDNKNVS